MILWFSYKSQLCGILLYPFLQAVLNGILMVREIMLNYIYIFKKAEIAYEYMDVSLLCVNHRHVSAAHVAIFKVANTRMQPHLRVGINRHFIKNII
jgi:hypothetical protein